MDAVSEGASKGASVPWLLFLYALAFLFILYVKDRVFLLKHGPMRTHLVNFLSNNIYFRPFGRKVVLGLDGADPKLLDRRVQGYETLRVKLEKIAVQQIKAKNERVEALQKKLGASKTAVAVDTWEQSVRAWQQHKHDSEKKEAKEDAVQKAEKAAVAYSKDCKQRLVDCRFKKVKVLGPILKELEVPEAYGNYVGDVAPDCGKVDVLGAGPHINLSCDAVKSAFPPEFHNEFQRKLAKRMAGSSASIEHSSIAITDDMVENFLLMSRLLSLSYAPKFRYALSGSEAVEIALKDVRYSTNKKYIIRFKGAYHGHTNGSTSFDSLSPESGHFIYLKEMDQKSLDFIEQYHYMIAGVIVNPMQYFTGVNVDSPQGEKMNTGKRDRANKHYDGKNEDKYDKTTSVSFSEYSQWLHRLQHKTQYCTKYLTPIAFIMDDIYFAFRHQSLFSHRFFTSPSGECLQPDVIILGKGIAGGYPISLVAGSEEFMMKRDSNYLLKVNRTVGTLSAWSRGLAACNVFLKQLLPRGEIADDEAPTKDWVKQLESSNARFDAWRTTTNNALEKAKLPVRIRGFCNTFSVDYLADSFYNSLYVQYLIAGGVFVSNQATGKFNLWCSMSDEDLKSLTKIMVEAAQQMQKDGFFEPKGGMLFAKKVPNPSGAGTVSRKFCTFTVLSKFFFSWLILQYKQIMLDKEIDIEVSHNHPVNKFTHFWSSVGMILFMYPAVFVGELKMAFICFLTTHALRQSGHFFYEKQDTDWEKQKFGHKDGSKKVAVLFIILVVLTYVFCYYQPVDWPVVAAAYAKKGALGTPVVYVATWLAKLQGYVTSEQYCTMAGIMTVMPHFLEIVHYYGLMRGIQWIVKILTDPFTDLPDFYHHCIIHPGHFLDLRQQRAVKYSLDIYTKSITAAALKKEV
eukprot:g5035.t1